MGQGGALFLSSWLTTLSVRDGLFLAAIVPAAAIVLAAVLVPRVIGAPGPQRAASR